MIVNFRIFDWLSFWRMIRGGDGRGINSGKDGEVFYCLFCVGGGIEIVRGEWFIFEV